MKIAIVGSRDFPQLKLVEQFIKDLPHGITLVSGGAKGVDATAREMAAKYGFAFEEYLPNLEGCKERHEFTKRYHERNQQIVDNADMVVAFTEKEKGGTWDTIKRARRKNIPVKIIRPFLLFPGFDEPDEDIDEDEVIPRTEKQKGKGPFHLKRITLGSFALTLKRYMDPLFLADLVNAKDNNPELFCELVLPTYLDFFEKYNPGYVHAISQAPKSKRNSGKQHCMDLVCKKVADALGCEFVELFENWDKPGRGVKNWDGQIVVKEKVKNYIGKIVYVLDDFVTTGQTLQKSCKALTSLEIHAHGVAFMLWS
jgi:phosphoribosylpyrophosphate synthetase